MKSNLLLAPAVAALMFGFSSFGADEDVVARRDLEATLNALQQTRR